VWQAGWCGHRWEQEKFDASLSLAPPRGLPKVAHRPGKMLAAGGGESHLPKERTLYKRSALNITNLFFSENILRLSDVNEHKRF